MENVISCSGLTHYYGNRLIYSDLSFEVPQGRILGLLGKNGTGKTTTINILSGFLKPHSGTCRLLGEDVRRMKPSTRQDIGMLIEGHIQYPFMTVGQIERFYASYYPRWNRDAYYGLLEQLQVSDSQKISTMSCGQRSQVALGLIMAQDPSLLILDDFSLGLDPGYRRLFIDYLRDYARQGNKTMFLTSHIIQDMERLIDDCIMMDYGKIIVHNPVDELLAKYRHCRFKTVGPIDRLRIPALLHPTFYHNTVQAGTLDDAAEVQRQLAVAGVPYADLAFGTASSLEDAFIGITGKY